MEFFTWKSTRQRPASLLNGRRRFRGEERCADPPFGALDCRRPFTSPALEGRDGVFYEDTPGGGGEGGERRSPRDAGPLGPVGAEDSPRGGPGAGEGRRRVATGSAKPAALGPRGRLGGGGRGGAGAGLSRAGAARATRRPSPRAAGLEPGSEPRTSSGRRGRGRPVGPLSRLCTAAPDGEGGSPGAGPASGGGGCWPGAIGLGAHTHPPTHPPTAFRAGCTRGPRLVLARGMV